MGDQLPSYQNDCENTALLPTSSETELSSSYAAAPLVGPKGKIALAAMAAASLLTIGAIINPTNDLVRDVLSKPTALFSIETQETGRNDNSKELIFLDRHVLNCGVNPMKSMHLLPDGGRIYYRYNCLKVVEDGIPLLSDTTKDNGFNDDPNLIYYDRQRVWCDDGQYLTKLVGRNSNGNFGYEFVCRTYDVSTPSCNEYYTNYNEATDKELVFLDRHNVECPGDSA